MVTVDEYARIRLGHRDGLSIRQLAQRFHHSRRKIRDILATPEPKSYQRLNPPPSILDPFKPIIDSILTGDEQAPRKQRHTAAKLFRRLRQEFGYSGGYDRVRRHLRSLHSPGPRSGPTSGMRLRPHRGRFPGGPPSSAGAGGDLVVVQLSLRHRLADRTHRGDLARHERSVCLLWLCAAPGLVGQPQDGRTAPVGRPEPENPRALSSLGQSLSLRAAVLPGAASAREAARRRPGAVFAARLGHARAAGQGPGGAQRPPAGLLPAGTRADPARTNRADRRSLRPRASAGLALAGARL
jgi:transposase